MHVRILVCASTLALLPSAAFAQVQKQGSQQQSAKPTQTKQERLVVPLDSRLLGTASLSEIRAFPEERQTPPSEVEHVAGISAVDQSYETDRSFTSTVSYFDQEFKSPGFQVQEQTTRPHSTVWTVRRPDGTIARVAVRNTTPTTFEIVEAAAAAENVTPEEPKDSRPSGTAKSKVRR